MKKIAVKCIPIFHKSLYYKGLGALKRAVKKGIQKGAYICIPFLGGGNFRRKPAYYIICFLLANPGRGRTFVCPFLGPDFPPGARVLYRINFPCKIITIVPGPWPLVCPLVMRGACGVSGCPLAARGPLVPGPFRAVFCTPYFVRILQGSLNTHSKDLKNWGE